MTCREGANFTGKWGPPAMYSIGGASAGLQLGGTAKDYVILVMTSGAANKLLEGKVKVGSDATAAAGSGASASTGNADMLTYSRTSGLFAGVSLDGASLSPDSDANQRLYDKSVSAREIVEAELRPHLLARPWLTCSIAKPAKCSNWETSPRSWTAPARYTLDTASLGPQLEARLPIMGCHVITERGAAKVLSGKLQLAADAAAQAGPSGARAAGFNDPNLDILSYQETKGLFAGAAPGSASPWQGRRRRQQRLRETLDATQILRDQSVPVPPAGQPLMNLLGKAFARGRNLTA